MDYIKIENAIRFLSKSFPKSDDPIKPVLLHSIRVGVMLVNQNRSTEVCIAGFLHDVVEDSKVTIQNIENNFGIIVKEIVLANTKNEKLEKEIRNDDVYKRCVKLGIDACLVKAAYLYDNIRYFSSIRNQNAINVIEYKRNSFLSFLPKEFNDPLFSLLRSKKLT